MDLFIKRNYDMLLYFPKKEQKYVKIKEFRVYFNNRAL